MLVTDNYFRSNRIFHIMIKKFKPRFCCRNSAFLAIANSNFSHHLLLFSLSSILVPGPHFARSFFSVSISAFSWTVSFPFYFFSTFSTYISYCLFTHIACPFTLDPVGRQIIHIYLFFRSTNNILQKKKIVA